MFRNRGRRRPADDGSPTLGIGALVRVIDDGRGDRWEDEPIGVIVAPGGNQIVGYPGIGTGMSWMVAFERPAYTIDGRGPFDRATIAARQLVALGVLSEGQAAPEDSGLPEG